MREERRVRGCDTERDASHDAESGVMVTWSRETSRRAAILKKIDFT